MRRIICLFVLTLAMPLYGVAQEPSNATPPDHGTPQGSSASRSVDTNANTDAKPPAKPKKKKKKPAPQSASSDAQPDTHGTPQTARPQQ